MIKRPNGGTGRHAGKVACALTAVAVAAAFTTADATAQQRVGTAHPGNDVFSIHVNGGGFFSGSSFSDGSRFEDGGALGATATFWAHPNVGLRANGLWFTSELRPGELDELLGAEEADMLHYSGDLLLRMPMVLGQSMSWYPYILGGIGGKSYEFDTLGSSTDFAANFGAGLELRFGQDGRWGLHTEVRDFVSNFDRAGLDDTLHDVVWTGGLSISF